MPQKKQPSKSREKLQQLEIEELRTQLAEAHETLRAIREGEVDALVVSGPKGEQVFSLVDADSVYRLIVETMKEAAFTVTFDGTILFCNAQFGEFLKRPLEQIVGHPLQDFVAPDNRVTADALLINSQSQPVKQRLVLRDSTDHWVPVHVSANVLNQPDGLSICVVATDLTELESSTEMIQKLRRQQEALQAANEELAAAEEELRVQNEELNTSRLELDKTRAQYENLFETAPDGYISTDADGTIQQVNQAAVRMFGRPASQLRGNPFSSLLPRSQREGHLQVLSALIEKHAQPPKWEVQIEPPDGRPFWAGITAAASRDDQGNIVGLRWLVRDISERKHAEEELRHAHERAAWLARLPEENPTPVVRASDDGLVLYTNPTAASLAGWSCKVNEPLPAALGHLAGKAAAEASAVEKEIELGGREYAVNVSPFPHDCYVNIYGRDITERKRAEEDLRRTSDELQRSNKDLEQFAYVASHDLQEPLRVVGGFVTLLRDNYQGCLDPKADEWIAYAVDGAKRMQSMINDLLHYSRAGSKGMQLAQVDLPAVVDHVKANLQKTIEESGALITVEPLPTVTADIAQLRQVFQNLLGNAIKFCVEGCRPEVHIGARREAHEWVLHVKDNGIGIDPKQVDNVFMLFRRLHSREKYSGSGIGLAICKKIIERHGGRIWVESEPDKGSTFYFTIPVTGE